MQTHIDPHILITRPQGRGDELYQELVHAGYKAVKQPVISVEKEDISAEQKQQLNDTSTLVFTSVYAVESAAEQGITLSDSQLAIAIGSATAKAVQQELGVVDVMTPKTPNSEGLLELANNLGLAELIICKGEGGRNMLESALIDDGIDVSEINLYHRTVVDIPQQQSSEWQQAGVNFILVTSIEIADNIYRQCDHQWLNSCHWIAASDRISRHIRKKGAANISVADSASNADMLTAIKEC